MRSIRTAMLLAAAALVAVAFAAPAVASAANWKQEGKELSGAAWTQEGLTMTSAGSLGVSGTLTIADEGLGNIACPVSATVSMSPNSNSGQLKEFSATIAKCKLLGTLGAICGENALSSLTLPSEPSAVQATEAGAITTPASFLAKINSCGLTLAYLGKMTMTPNNSSAIGSVSLSGSLTTYWHNEGTLTEISKATPTGTLTASPAGKYGISKQRLIKVTGTIQRTGPEGFYCPVSGTVSLEPGSSAGKLVSLSNTETCGTGWCKPSTLSVSSPWTLSDTGSAIKATGVSWSGSGCIDTISGVETTISVNNTSAISSSSFSFEVKTPTGFHQYNGALNWSPAGVYGL